MMRRCRGWEASEMLATSVVFTRISAFHFYLCIFSTCMVIFHNKKRKILSPEGIKKSNLLKKILTMSLKEINSISFKKNNRDL